MPSSVLIAFPFRGCSLSHRLPLRCRRLSGTTLRRTHARPVGALPIIQSYAVDTKLRTEDLPLERVDEITGAVLTGVIGFFVVVDCAATLHRERRSIRDGADAAVDLEPGTVHHTGRPCQA